jgi:hypothetical protein
VAARPARCRGQIGTLALRFRPSRPFDRDEKNRMYPLPVAASLASLLESAATADDGAYVMNARFELVLVSEGWERFAEQNGGEDAMAPAFGKSVLAAMSPLLAHFYRDVFNRVSTTGRRWKQYVECSSESHFRLYEMTVQSAEGHLAVHHAKLEERPYDEPLASLHPSHLGSVACVHCHRVRSASDASRWELVPDILRARPASVGEAFCPTCFRQSYGPSIRVSGQPRRPTPAVPARGRGRAT